MHNTGGFFRNTYLLNKFARKFFFFSCFFLNSCVNKIKQLEDVWASLHMKTTVIRMSYSHSVFMSFYKFSLPSNFLSYYSHSHQTTPLYVPCALLCCLFLNQLLLVFHRLRYCLCLCYYFSVWSLYICVNL